MSDSGASKGWPFVSIIVPVYNERGSIAACLDSLLNQTYPSDSFEVIVVDGGSTDGTLDELHHWLSSLSVERKRLFLVADNPLRTAASSMNKGIGLARGSIIARLDGHARASSQYLEALVSLLAADATAWCVGPVLDTEGHGRVGRAISHAQASAIGVGNASFRTGAEVDEYVDTVAFGAYWRCVFDRIGLFDETLIKNQDDEFNGRVIRAGGKIRLSSRASVTYGCRDTWRSLARQYFAYGFYKPLVAVRLRRPATFRQFAPVALVGVLLVASLDILFGRPVRGASVILSYVGLLSICSGWRTDLRRSAVAAAIMHVSYGAGYWAGVGHVLRKRDFRSATEVRCHQEMGRAPA
jgi:glycosyltransferase involved in cell wall biosynthesis